MKKRSNKPQSNTPSATRARRARVNLSPGYVRGLLTKGTSLKTGDIPETLLQAKQAHLILQRTVKAVQEGDQDKVKDLSTVQSSLKESWAKQPSQKGRVPTRNSRASR